MVGDYTLTFSKMQGFFRKNSWKKASFSSTCTSPDANGRSDYFIRRELWKKHRQGLVKKRRGCATEPLRQRVLFFTPFRTIRLLVFVLIFVLSYNFSGAETFRSIGAILAGKYMQVALLGFSFAALFLFHFQPQRSRNTKNVFII